MYHHQVMYLKYGIKFYKSLINDCTLMLWIGQHALVIVAYFVIVLQYTSFHSCPANQAIFIVKNVDL